MPTIKEILAEKAARDAEKPVEDYSLGLRDNIIFSIALKNAGVPQDCIDDCIFLYDYDKRESLLKYFEEKRNGNNTRCI